MDFVLFSPITWDDQGGAHRPTQLALALARRSHRVLFVEIGQRASQAVEPNIEITSLGALGMTEAELRRAWFGFDDLSRINLAETLSALLARFERAGPRVVIAAIAFPPFVRLWPVLRARDYAILYDCLDDFEDAEERGHFFSNPQAEKFLVQHVDMVTTVTPALVEKFRAWGGSAPVECLPNGLNPGFHARGPAPSDLCRGEVTLGFWGPIQDYTVDTNLLVYLAQARPDWTLNLIGAYDLPRSPLEGVNTLRALPNVRLLGPRPHDTLMDYLSGFDICLLPFPDDVFSRGRDPIKLYEYLAGYKPVVGSHTPQLAGIPYVSVAHSPAEFLAQIEEARGTPVDKQVVDRFLRANSWDARAEKLLKLVADLPPRERKTESLSVPDHFEDPSNLAERTQAYLAHLEQTADERLAYIGKLERHARDTEAYVKKLERTHPLVWLKRLIRRR